MNVVERGALLSQEASSCKSLSNENNAFGIEAILIATRPRLHQSICSPPMARRQSRRQSSSPSQAGPNSAPPGLSSPFSDPWT